MHSNTMQYGHQLTWTSISSPVESAIPLSCPFQLDLTWGPFNPCRHDFTFLFELVVLSAMPAAIFLLFSFFRFYFISKSDVKVIPHWIRYLKLALSTSAALLRLVLLVLWTQTKTRDWLLRVTIPVEAINLAAMVQLVLLSYTEHDRSIKPSALIEAYLLFSSFLEIPQARTLFLLKVPFSIPVIFSCMLVLKFGLLVNEARSKIAYIDPKYQNLSPEETHGLISNSFIWWINPLLAKGSSKILDQDDLDTIDTTLTPKRWREPMIEAWEASTNKTGQHALQLALFKVIRNQLLTVFFPRLCLVGFLYLQPALVSLALQTVSRTDEASQYEGYGIIIATAIVYLGIALCKATSSRNMTRLSTMIRSSLVSLIYQHSLSLEDRSDRDNAEAMTLMGTDVDRITSVISQLNNTWAALLEAIIGLYWLTRELGWASVVPLLVIGGNGWISSYPASKMGQRSKQWSGATQQRIAIVSTLISEMKSIKMTGLTERLHQMVQATREQELKDLEAFCTIPAYLSAIASSPAVQAPAFTFVAYSILAYIRSTPPLNPTRAFTSLALISLISTPTSLLMARLPLLMSTFANYQRVQDFLNKKTRVDHRIVFGEEQSSNASAEDINELNAGISIKLDDVTIKPADQAEPVLTNVSLVFKKGSITVLTGVVGSGKTTLLRALLGEIIPDTGKIYLQAHQRIAYCSQTSWLPNGTIKSLIYGPGTENIDYDWYKNVVAACALEEDLANLPMGDDTLVGTKGIVLSGGQKQRVALARALYGKPQILILDDILSALDRQTQQFIRTRIFGTDGLLRKLNSTIIMATHATQDLFTADNIVVLSADNTSLTQGDIEYLREQGLTKATEEKATQHPDIVAAPADKVEETNKSPAPEQDKKEDQTRQTGDSKVLFYYFNHLSKTYLAINLISVIASAGADAGGYFVLKRWSELNGQHFEIYGTLYLVFGLAYPFTVFGMMWSVFVKISPSTGRKLHEVVLQTTLKAPLSFFSQIDRGSLITRFSNDIRMVEWAMSIALLTLIPSLTSIIAGSVLITSGSAYMAATIPILAFVLYSLQKYYLKTSRQLRLIDLESKSPLANQFLETLEGLTTIRAFGWQAEYTEENSRRLVISQTPTYHIELLSAWLKLVLDLIVCGLAITVMSLAMNLKSSTNAGLLGISLTALISFNTLMIEVITGWTSLENCLGAVYRIRNFEATTEKEAKVGEDLIPEESWPSNGKVEISNISASYNDTVIALRNISITILPGQRLGICGRTGSGKSTLISSILRLIDPSSGSIQVDSLDLSTIPRDVIRRRFTTLPQDAVYLPGTVRLNTDPWEAKTDEEVIEALTKVSLWKILEKRGGLEADLKPDTLSKGQQQLLALARALLSKSKLVILDEATSSVDGETERLMREVIAEEFKGCIIITVAHRPETILDSDLVAVMESGDLVEFGPPNELLEKQGSKLKALVQH